MDGTQNPCNPYTLLTSMHTISHIPPRYTYSIIPPRHHYKTVPSSHLYTTNLHSLPYAQDICSHTLLACT
jgi:hypothetical protein